ncbi:MAG: HPr family phosphocarrier protein [Eubacterium aggregans]
MYVKEVKVVNPTGLHARPAAEFTKVAGQYQADLTIVRLTDQPKEGNAKSVGRQRKIRHQHYEHGTDRGHDSENYREWSR